MTRGSIPAAAIASALVLAVAGGARAQAGEAADPAPADDGAPPAGGDEGVGPAGSSSTPAGEAPTDAGEPGGSGGPVEPGAAGASPAADEGQSDLEREQAAMEAEGDPDVPDEETEEEDEAESLDHEYQVGLRFGAGVPFVFALRYGDGPRCEASDDTFCVFVGSGIIDGELSFGVTPDLEITAMGRVGMIGVEPTAQRQILLGLGIRSYLSPESMFKFFLGAKLLLDLTPAGGQPEWGPVDLGVRGEAGVQLDIVRYLGLYIQVGVNVTVLRAFAISPDVTGGFQVRFP